MANTSQPDQRKVAEASRLVNEGSTSAPGGQPYP